MEKVHDAAIHLMTHSPHLLCGGLLSVTSVPFLEMQSGTSEGRISAFGFAAAAHHVAATFGARWSF